MNFALFESGRAESEARIEFVRKLSPGSHIHLSAICGTGMGSVASLLKQLGYKISGSDKAFYPPMGEVVRALTSQLYEGYDPTNLSPKPDLVVIGNNLSKTNPEVEAVLSQGIPFASMSEVLGALLIGTLADVETSVVVSGTHGKTTTTAAIATMLDRAGRKPGYLVGGVPKDLSSSVRPADGSQSARERVVVLEGDEYDSAFFAKWPKFLAYRPNILVVTSLEFDHADIYENLSEIEREFTRLVSMVPENGVVIVSNEGESLPKLFSEWSKIAKCPVYQYGPGANCHVIDRTPNKEGQSLKLQLHKSVASFTSVLSGPQNAQNLLAAALVGERLGLSVEEIEKNLSQFHGVLRRQTLRGEFGGVLLIEDFAHHPTAVRLTLQGIKESYPGKRLVAAFEPRSNTTRRGFFQEDYPASLAVADVVTILEVQEKSTYSNTSLEARPVDILAMAENIRKLGKESHHFQQNTELEKWLCANVRSGDVLVCMSNGDFGGLVQNLEKRLGV
jgi:UDP-N-acetylmuramate: L-alanyl-gamma-D-glutamyl-meso-diaminopimelate ligase